MAALRYFVRDRETHLWKETEVAAGIECPPEQAGEQSEDYTKLGSGRGSAAGPAWPI